MNVKRGFVVLLVSFVFVFSIFGVSAYDPDGAWHSINDSDWSQTIGSVLKLSNWIHLEGAVGLYSPSFGNYFWPPNSYYWTMRSNRGLQLQDNAGTVKGYLYHSGNYFGLLDGDGTWAVLVLKDAYVRFYINAVEKLRVSNTQTTAYGNLYASGGTVGGTNGLRRSSCHWVNSPWSCQYQIYCPSGYYQAGLRSWTGGTCPLGIYCCKAS
jgi:hypothetical protein